MYSMPMSSLARALASAARCGTCCSRTRDHRRRASWCRTSSRSCSCRAPLLWPPAASARARVRSASASRSSHPRPGSPAARRGSRPGPGRPARSRRRHASFELDAALGGLVGARGTRAGRPRRRRAPPAWPGISTSKAARLRGFAQLAALLLARGAGHLFADVGLGGQPSMCRSMSATAASSAVVLMPLTMSEKPLRASAEWSLAIMASFLDLHGLGLRLHLTQLAEVVAHQRLRARELLLQARDLGLELLLLEHQVLADPPSRPDCRPGLPPGRRRVGSARLGERPLLLRDLVAQAGCAPRPGAPRPTASSGTAPSSSRMAIS